MRMKNVALRFLLSLLALTAFPSVGQASVHQWRIKEVFSNADGRVQFIELHNPTAATAETQTMNTTITAADGSTEVFTFSSNLAGNTANKHLLLATPGFAALPGAVTPDFTLPCGPLFDPNAGSITLTFSGSGDSITFSNVALPDDGTNSLTDSDLGVGTTLAASASSPTNFAGNVGAVVLTGCLAAGTCEPCDDGTFCNGAESCSGSACVAGTACADICDEGADTCIECDDAGDCNDSNPCTDDSCNGSNVCVNANNTDACNDGLFCTLTDACSGGSCMGSGDACPGEQCLEGSDACGACNSASDCNDADPCTADTCDGSGACQNDQEPDGTACPSDGDFCTGVEQCSSGNCVSLGDPCPSDQTCNESGDRCDPLCGNGELDSGEDCDDANDTDDDGCSACSIDSGYNCTTNVEPSICSVAPDGGPDHDAGVSGDGDAAAGGDGDRNDDAGPGAGGDGDGDGDSDGGPSGGMNGGGSDNPLTDAGTGAGEASDDGNCTCRLPRSSSNRSALPMLMLGIALMLRRIRRT